MTKNSPNNLHIINSNLQIPFEFKTLLNLGLKFSFQFKPNYDKLEKSLQEGMRKIGWLAYFSIQNTNREFNKLDKLLYTFKKKNFTLNSHSPLEDEIFCNINVKHFSKQLRSYTNDNYFILNDLLKSFLLFQRTNDFIIKPADKNAGICIMRKEDYNNEVYNILDDLNTYVPIGEYQYFEAVDKFKHDVKNSLRIMPKDFDLLSLIPKNFKPCKFYILPKIHKKFNIFPKGRPISSTINAINQGISQLIDLFL